MANWISVNKGGWLDKAITNYTTAKSAAIQTAKNDLKGDVDRLKNGTWLTTSKDNIPVSELLSGSESSSPKLYGGGGSGGSGAGGGNSYSDVMQLISDTAKANNEWSAEQAHKQMEFQERMARNAHTYEVEDLKNAGLNPVLSAGGNGAAVPSGAMGDTDTSNTRLLAEVASEAVQSLGMTAAGYANAKQAEESGSFLGKLTNLYSKNKLFKKFVDTGLSTASKFASYAYLKKIF